MGNTFPIQTGRFYKAEHLCSKKLISYLFEKGKQIKYPDFRFFYKPAPVDSPQPHQVLFSVPRKLFNKASVRNIIRRRLKEAYRKNKGILYENTPAGISYLIAYIYISKNIQVYNKLEKQVKDSIEYVNLKNNNP